MSDSTWRIKPSLGNVLVEPQTEASQQGTIHLVSFIEKETHICEVIETCDPYEAVASDRSIQQGGPIYPVGTLVIIGKYNGREIKWNESHPDVKERKRYILIRESDILATLELRDAQTV